MGKYDNPELSLLFEKTENGTYISNYEDIENLSNIIKEIFDINNQILMDLKKIIN